MSTTRRVHLLCCPSIENYNTVCWLWHNFCYINPIITPPPPLKFRWKTRKSFYWIYDDNHRLYAGESLYGSNGSRYCFLFVYIIQSRNWCHYTVSIHIFYNEKLQYDITGHENYLWGATWTWNSVPTQTLRRTQKLLQFRKLGHSHPLHIIPVVSLANCICWHNVPSGLS